jgi:hypothetical protein
VGRPTRRGLTKLRLAETIWPALLGLALLAACTHPGRTGPATASPTSPANATTATAIGEVLAAFSEHPVVAIGEVHGSQVEHDFLTALLEDPRTPSVIDDIVVEFGTARYQSVMDRYVAGEVVDEQELRRVWTETTQTSGVWNLPMYRRFFETVRDVNAGLPADRRLRVLLGDPPVDRIALAPSASCDDSDPSCPDYWLLRRDEHFAMVVERESLEKGRHALLIAGIYHLIRGEPAGVTVRLDQRHPGATYVILPHDPQLVARAVANRISTWPVPSVTPLAGSWLGKQTWQTHSGTVTCDGPDCEDDPSFPAPTTLAEAADAYLYLGATLLR